MLYDLEMFPVMFLRDSNFLKIAKQKGVSRVFPLTGSSVI